MLNAVSKHTQDGKDVNVSIVTSVTQSGLHRMLSGIVSGRKAPGPLWQGSKGGGRSRGTSKSSRDRDVCSCLECWESCSQGEGELTLRWESA